MKKQNLRVPVNDLKILRSKEKTFSLFIIVIECTKKSLINPDYHLLPDLYKSYTLDDFKVHREYGVEKVSVFDLKLLTLIKLTQILKKYDSSLLYKE